MDDDDVEFADARDHFSPGAELPNEAGMMGMDGVLNGIASLFTLTMRIL